MGQYNECMKINHVGLFLFLTAVVFLGALSVSYVLMKGYVRIGF